MRASCKDIPGRLLCALPSLSPCLVPHPLPGDIVLDQDVLRNTSLPIKLPAGSNLTIISNYGQVGALINARACQGACLVHGGWM